MVNFYCWKSYSLIIHERNTEYKYLNVTGKTSIDHPNYSVVPNLFGCFNRRDPWAMTLHSLKRCIAYK
jgi:hypothetical protein